MFFLFDLQKNKNPQWFKIRRVAWWSNCMCRLQSTSEGSYQDSALVQHLIQHFTVSFLRVQTERIWILDLEVKTNA